MKRILFPVLIALLFVSCSSEPRKPLPYNDCHVYIRNESNYRGYCQISKSGGPASNAYHPIGPMDKGNILSFSIDMDSEYTVKLYLISGTVYEMVGDTFTSHENVLASKTMSFTTTYHTNHVVFELHGSEIGYEFSQYDIYEYEPKEN